MWYILGISFIAWIVVMVVGMIRTYNDGKLEGKLVITVGDIVMSIGTLILSPVIVFITLPGVLTTWGLTIISDKLESEWSWATKPIYKKTFRKGRKN